MRKVVFATLLVASAAFTMKKAHAGEYMYGKELRQYCMGNQSDRNVCLGYLEGIASALHENRVNSFSACIPSKTTAGALLNVYVNFMASHPEWDQQFASGLVAHSFREVWPCTES